MLTIGLVANVYNEAKALPGWLETHLPFFDDVRVLHSGPNNEYSNDGTIEILEKWNIPVQYCSIDEGFGVVRTKALRMCPCDWIMLLDADERFYHIHKRIDCVGSITPHSEVDKILRTYDFSDIKTRLPDWDNIARLGSNLEVIEGEVYDQGKFLRGLISDSDLDAVISIRRHWHDFTFKRPTQNWFSDLDCQMRIVRNDSSIHYDANTRMHERLLGANRVGYTHMSTGPFFDHFHFTFKKMEIEQRAHDVAIYDAIHKGEKPPTKREFYKKVLDI